MVLDASGRVRGGVRGDLGPVARGGLARSRSPGHLRAVRRAGRGGHRPRDPRAPTPTPMAVGRGAGCLRPLPGGRPPAHLLRHPGRPLVAAVDPPGPDHPPGLRHRRRRPRGVGSRRPTGPSRGPRRLLDAVVAAMAVLALAWVFLVVPGVLPRPTRRSPSASCSRPTQRPRCSSSRWAPDCLLRVRSPAVGLPPRTPRVTTRCWSATSSTCSPTPRMVELPTHVIDVAYVLAFVAFTAAVVHPSVRKVGEVIPSAGRAPAGPAPLRRRGALGAGDRADHADAVSDGGERLVLAGIVLALTVTASWRLFRALHQHATSQDRIAYQATHDSLTGLPNRVFLEEHLDRVLDVSRGGRETSRSCCSTSTGSSWSTTRWVTPPGTNC